LPSPLMSTVQAAGSKSSISFNASFLSHAMCDTPKSEKRIKQAVHCEVEDALRPWDSGRATMNQASGWTRRLARPGHRAWTEPWPHSPDCVGWRYPAESRSGWGTPCTWFPKKKQRVAKMNICAWFVFTCQHQILSQTQFIRTRKSQILKDSEKICQY
jgi:hypothetical protein